MPQMDVLNDLMQGMQNWQFSKILYRKRFFPQLTCIHACRICDVNTEYTIETVHIMVFVNKKIEHWHSQIRRKIFAISSSFNSAPNFSVHSTHCFCPLMLNVLHSKCSRRLFPDNSNDDDDDKNELQKMSKLLIEMSSSTFADMNLCDSGRSESSFVRFFFFVLFSGRDFMRNKKLFFVARDEHRKKQFRSRRFFF